MFFQTVIMRKKRRSLFFVKLFNYEYWPFWLFFLPLVPWWIYLAIRARSLTYFTAANPGIEHGGVFGESKIDILNKIDPSYLPATEFFQKSSTPIEVITRMGILNLEFPVILKPNIGERGNEVEKINNQAELEHYLSKNDEDFIVQEYVDYDLELGILYYCFPNNGKTGITSIVKKEFLGITGDGKSTIRELIEQSDRARLQLENLSEKFSMNQVLKKEEYLNLEPIGNHCRGTKFLSGMDLLNDQLVKIFDDIAGKIEGFNFGRFDLKVKSVEDLMKGENIKILELNGVTSEPAHIYDPKWTLLRAYKDTASNMQVMMKVSKANMKAGVKITPFFKMFRLVRAHFSSNGESENESPLKPSMQK